MYRHTSAYISHYRGSAQQNWPQCQKITLDFVKSSRSALRNKNNNSPTGVFPKSGLSVQTLHFLPRGSGSPRADRQKTLGWGKRMQDPVLCRPKPTPRPNEHVRARTEEERRAGFAHPCGEPSSHPPLLLCAQVPDGLFSTAAFFSLNEGVVPGRVQP